MTLLPLLALPLVGAGVVATLGRGRPEVARWSTVREPVTATPVVPQQWLPESRTEPAAG